MSIAHKNKTFATLLAALLGALGAHRFYLRGGYDRLGVIHLASLPLAGMVYGLMPHVDGFYKALPLVLSAIVALVEALTIGLTSDDKFDDAYNPASGRKSDSRWPLALALVVIMILGSTGTIFTIARLFALLYTGNADG